MSSLDRDIQNADYVLRENANNYSLDYYVHVFGIYGDGQIDLINLYSAFRGYLYIMVDGDSFGRLIIGEGVQNIPLHIEFDEGVNFYVRPHETVGEYDFGSEDNYSIQMFVI